MITFTICPKTAEIKTDFDHDHDFLTSDDLVQALQFAYLVGVSEGIRSLTNAMREQDVVKAMVSVSAWHESICHRVSGGAVI